MSIEELLKPRYKIIALWLHSNSKLQVGDILNYDTEYDVFLCKGEVFNPQDLEKYPHLFLRLQWYENRSPEIIESVGYIKDINQKKVYKVMRWTARMFGYMSGVRDAVISEDWEYYPHSQMNLYNYHLPASEQEYNDYINSKTNQ